MVDVVEWTKAKPCSRNISVLSMKEVEFSLKFAADLDVHIFIRRNMKGVISAARAQGVL